MIDRSNIIENVYSYILKKVKSDPRLSYYVHTYSDSIRIKHTTMFCIIGDNIKYTEFDPTHSNGLDNDWEALNLKDPLLFEWIDDYIIKFGNILDIIK